MLLFYLTLQAFMLGSQSQVIPSSFSFSTSERVSVNGSSATGHCSSVTTSGGVTTCTQPASSVLFDGNIPTLTGLGGVTWASQFLILQKASPSSRIDFYFGSVPGYVGVRRAEVVLFNCPGWGISVHTDLATSCDSLVRLCIPLNIPQYISALFLEFEDTRATWEYFAEVTFYSSGSTCPPDTIVRFTTPPAPMPDTNTPPTLPHTSTAVDTLPYGGIITVSALPEQPPATPDMTSFSRISNASINESTTSTTSVQGIVSKNGSKLEPDPEETPISECMVCPSCSTSTILVSVTTAIATALLAIVIFVLVQIAVCKCHRAEAAASSAEKGGHLYEQVCEGSKKSEAESDPTYMEIGAGGEKAFQLKENEAYAIPT